APPRSRWTASPVRMHALPFGAHGCFRGEHLRGVAPNGKVGFRIAGFPPGPTERSGSARTGLSPVRSHALPSVLARSPGGGASYGGVQLPERPTMLQPGDIVVERVTCNRATVTRVARPEETISRFGDGRI